MKEVAVRLIQIGILILSSAIFWWHSFYRVITQQIIPTFGESDPTIGVGFTCLYSTEGLCGEIIVAGETLGVTAYTPTIFWLGVALLLSGVFMLLGTGGK